MFSSRKTVNTDQTAVNADLERGILNLVTAVDHGFTMVNDGLPR